MTTLDASVKDVSAMHQDIMHLRSKVNTMEKEQQRLKAKIEVLEKDSVHEEAQDDTDDITCSQALDQIEKDINKDKEHKNKTDKTDKTAENKEDKTAEKENNHKKDQAGKDSNDNLETPVKKMKLQD